MTAVALVEVQASVGGDCLRPAMMASGTRYKRFHRARSIQGLAVASMALVAKDLLTAAVATHNNCGTKGRSDDSPLRFGLAISAGTRIMLKA